MHFVFFCHSLVSDWSHDNARFVGGVVTELLAGGHTADVYEPEDGWSRTQLRREQGEAALVAFRQRFPHLHARRYRPGGPDLERALGGADVVVVHEWTEPALVAAIGAHRAAHGRYRLLYHDTHPRALVAGPEWQALALDGYDAALVACEALADAYRRRSAPRGVHVWAPAADARVARAGARFTSSTSGPAPDAELVCFVDGAAVDDPSVATNLEELLLGPLHALDVRAAIFGARLPAAMRIALERAGAALHGHLPGHAMSAAVARAQVALHVPLDGASGVPGPRPLELLACGVPLISAPWGDGDRLLEPDRDLIVARSGREIVAGVVALLGDPQLARALAARGREAVLSRHTCAHRAAELVAIARGLELREAA